MAERRRIEGWKLPPRARGALLARFPPRYPVVVADHITFKPGPQGAPMPDVARALVVGRADDGQGVEALVVDIGGTIRRPDGSLWHITWSLAEGRQARESNDVLARLGWQPLERPVPIPLERGWWLWP